MRYFLALFLSCAILRGQNIPIGTIPQGVSTTNDFVLGSQGGLAKLFPAPYPAAQSDSNYVAKSSGFATNLTISGGAITGTVAAANGSVFSNSTVAGSLTVRADGNIAIDQQQIFPDGGPGLGGIRIVDGNLGGAAAIEHGIFYGGASGLTNGSWPGTNVNIAAGANVTFVTNANGQVTALAVGLTNTPPTISGDYQSVFSPASDTSLPNKIGFDGGATIRQSGAAFSGIYSRIVPGSASAMSDLPSRGFDRWGGMTKPFFIISTRNAGSTGPGATTITTVTNGARVFTTNGYVQAWTNFGVQVSFILESPGWVTNFRSFQGYLCWNTNRFPLGWVSAGLFGEPYIATNITTYLRTNGYEPWVMMYATSLVPATNHWNNNGYPVTFANNSGNTEWDGFGSNPFGANEYAITCNPESIHRDVSYLYANDFAGLIFQDVNQSQAGYFDQVVRMMQGAILNPYYINQDWSGHGLVDGTWLSYSTVFLQNGRNAKHAMASGMFMAASGGPNPPKYSIDLNAIFNESNDTMTGPAGSSTTGTGWTMNQAKWKSVFLTNAFGFCHPTFATDGNTYNSWTYNDWLGHFNVVAFFNANPFFMSDGGGANQWGYATGVNFSNLVKTVGYNWIKVNQDVSLNPPICLSLNTNNSIWWRTLSDGSKLVLMENSLTTSSTNLTVNWSQLGIASNTIVAPVDVMTNVYLGLYTNSITWSVPLSSSFLFRIPPQILADSGTNSGQMFYDTATSSDWITTQNNLRSIRIHGPSGVVIVGTNATGTIGTTASALQAIGIAGGTALTLYDSGGSQYDFSRSGTTGNMRIIGYQGDANSGISIESSAAAGVGTEIIRLNGMGFYFVTNAIAQWMTTPLTRGGFGLVNSNSSTYVMQSSPAGNAWVDTNGIPAIKTSFATADLGNSTATFGSPTVDKNVFVVNGRKYSFTYTLYFTESVAAEGMKVDFNGGGATMTSFKAHGELIHDTGGTTNLTAATSTTLAGVINIATTANANQHRLEVKGSIEPSGSGTFIPRVAQNSHASGTLTSLRGSVLIVTECY